jgi:Ca2+-binding EF-hand superfamily protein
MKNSPRILIAVLAAAIAFPATALAAKADRKNKKDAAPAVAFTTVDKDTDGSISKEEFVAAMKEKLGEDAAKARFATLDKDSSGKLSKEEYAADSGEVKKRRKKNTN